jgi:hypothetical protein
MKIADLSSGASKLQRAVKTLNARWQQTELSWHDPVSRKFEQEFLSLIEPQVMATLERLSSLSQVLNNAEQECS